jgi:hypothetical protein
MKSINKKKKQAIKGVPEKKPDLFTRYNAMDAKSNVNHALIKTLVDTIAGVMIGPTLSATLGKYAPAAGIGLTFGGHYTGDQTGLMRGIGMSTLAHSVAKTREYRQQDSTLKARLAELKDDWLRLVLLKNTEVPKLEGIKASDEVKRAVEQEIIREYTHLTVPEPIFQPTKTPEYSPDFQSDSSVVHNETDAFQETEENWDDPDFSEF